MKSYRFVFLSIISAVLLVLSHPSPGMWAFAWFAFVPLFIALDGKKFLDAWLLGFLSGVVFFYGAISWLNSIAVMATVGLVLYLALYFSFFAAFTAAILKKNLPVFLKCAIIASWWVALEFIRSNFLTGFGWALLGYSQSPFLPAIQIADITGAYGVSFIVMFTNVVIYEFFASRGQVHPDNNFTREPVPTMLFNNRLINFLACIFLIAVVFIYGFYKLNFQFSTPNSQLKISLIQGNIPQSLKWNDTYRKDIIKTYFDFTMEAAKDKPDLIVWPETSFPVDLELEPAMAKRLFNLAKAVNTHILVGTNRYKSGNIYNSAFLISPDGAIMSYYDKLHLVPFGEYMPKIPGFLYKVLPEKINMVGDFSPGGQYTVFKNFSVLICFEDVFPQISRRFVQNGAQFLVNITNDGWYGASAAPFQHAQASVFRAVENRVPVVRCANTGLSEFIDKNGRITSGMKPFSAGYKTENISINPANSSSLQGIFVVISFLLSFCGFGIIFLRH